MTKEDLYPIQITASREIDYLAGFEAAKTLLVSIARDKRQIYYTKMIKDVGEEEVE